MLIALQLPTSFYRILRSLLVSRKSWSTSLKPNLTFESHSRLLDSNKQLQCQGTQIDQNNRNCMYTVIACFLGSQDQNDIRKWDVSLSDMVWQGFWACTAINLIRTPDMKFDTKDYNAAVGGQTFARRSVFATIFHFWPKNVKALKLKPT